MRWRHDARIARLNFMTTFHSHQERSFRLVAPGVEFCVLRHHADDGMTLLVRMAAGADARLHDHPGGEETYLLSGRLRVGGQELVPGDYLYTPPGERHDGHAHEEALFFVVVPGGLRVI